MSNDLRATNARLSAGMFALCLAMPLVVLAGWALDIGWARGLGVATVPIRPYSTVFFALAMLGALCVSLGWRTVAMMSLTIAAVLIGFSMAQNLSSADFGLSRLFFPESAGRFWQGNGALPGYGPHFGGLAALAVTLLMASRRRLLRAWVAPVVSVGLAGGVVLMTFAFLKPSGYNPHFGPVSITSGIPFLLFCIAALVQTRDQRKPSFAVRSSWNMLGKYATLIVLLPVLPTVVSVYMREYRVGWIDPDFVVLMGNVTLLAGLLLFVIRTATGEARTLAARESQMRSILSTMPDPVIVTDADGIILEFSPAASRFWEVAPAQAIGAPVTSLFGSRLAEQLVELDGASKAGGGGVTLAGLARQGDGTERRVELRLLGWAAGEERHYTLLVQDISARLRREDDVRELGYEIAQLSRQNAMGDLAADIAHEINQPLAAAANYASAARMLLDDGADPKVSAFLTEISGQMQRAGEIIRRLRQFVRTHDVEKRNEALCRLIDEAARLVFAGSHKLECDVEISCRGDLEVFGDRVQMQQVIVNILRNAVEACQGASGTGKVSIEACPTDAGMVEVRISDNGPGLPPGFKERLGARFISTKGAEASGIGLSISKRIVEAHGGNLEARNRPEGGASFIFTVPSAS